MDARQLPMHSCSEEDWPVVVACCFGKACYSSVPLTKCPVVVLRVAALTSVIIGCASTRRVWGADVGPYMQLLHACFAIGTVFGPLVVGIVLDMCAAPNLSGLLLLV